MAQHVTVAEIQQFLDGTKITVSSVDAELELTAASYVLSHLSHAFDVSGWVDNTTTPQLVKDIIAMLMASWIYARQYSEASGDSLNPYADKLEVTANDLMFSIVDGEVTLLDASSQSTAGGLIEIPTYFPTDTTGSAITYDGLGNQVGAEGSEDVKFRMGQMF